MTALRRRLDALVPQALRITGTPGASVAARVGREQVACAYGVADVETGTEMTPASLFPLGSMSKLYTCVAVLQLAERGLVSLEEEVLEHATVRELLSFRGGLATDCTHCSFGAPPPLADHVAAELASGVLPEYGGAIPLWQAAPGERYGYSNLGVAVLGRLVEQRNPCGLGFAEYVERHVMRPLGMRRGRFGDWRDTTGVVPGYMGFGARVIRSPLLRSGDFPANGVLGVPEEHSRLLEALLDAGAPVLRPESCEAMLTPHVPVGGEGALWPDGEWWTGLLTVLYEPGRGRGHIGHPGSHTWGWWNVSRAYPALDCTVTVCVNRWDMMRWHNPANPEAAGLIADAVARWAATRDRPPLPERPWAFKRGHLAATIVAERTLGLLGLPEIPPSVAEAMIRSCSRDERDGFRAGLSDAPPGPLGPGAAAELFEHSPVVAPEERELLLLDLGAVYGFPVPLWFWGQLGSLAPDALRRDLPPSPPAPESRAGA